MSLSLLLLLLFLHYVMSYSVLPTPADGNLHILYISLLSLLLSLCFLISSQGEPAPWAPCPEQMTPSTWNIRAEAAKPLQRAKAFIHCSSASESRSTCLTPWYLKTFCAVMGSKTKLGHWSMHQRAGLKPSWTPSHLNGAMIGDNLSLSGKAFRCL